MALAEPFEVRGVADEYAVSLYEAGFQFGSRPAWKLAEDEVAVGVGNRDSEPRRAQAIRSASRWSPSASMM